MNKTFVFWLFVNAIVSFICGWSVANINSANNISPIKLNENADVIQLGATSEVKRDHQLKAYCDAQASETVEQEIHSLADEVIKLREKNTALQLQMRIQVEKASKDHQALVEKLHMAKMMMEKQGVNANSISEHDTRQHLPSPFAEVVFNSLGALPGAFKDLIAQEQDYQWATLMQQHISDFHLTHQLSNQINLQSVICKTSMCEIRGFQETDKVQNVIMSEMSKQPWWQFNSTYSTSASTKEHGKYFYVLVSNKNINKPKSD